MAALTPLGKPQPPPGVTINAIIRTVALYIHFPQLLSKRLYSATHHHNSLGENRPSDDPDAMDTEDILPHLTNCVAVAEAITNTPLSKLLNARYVPGHGTNPPHLAYPNQEIALEATSLLPLTITLEGAFTLYMTTQNIPPSTLDKMVLFTTTLPHSQCVSNTGITAALQNHISTLYKNTSTTLLKCKPGSTFLALGKEFEHTPVPHLRYLNLETGQVFDDQELGEGNPLHSDQGVPARHLPNSTFTTMWALILQTKHQAAILQLAMLLNQPPPTLTHNAVPHTLKLTHRDPKVRYRR